jgi:hypothetical protein
MEGDVELSGIYRGSNGGRGDVKLTKANHPSKSINDSELFIQLRQKQQARKTAQTRGRQDTVAHSPSLKPVWETNDSLHNLYDSEQLTFTNMQKRKDSVFAILQLPDSMTLIELALYDNAEIDGDTVSLFIDNVLVLHKVPLSTKPLIQRIHKPASKKVVDVKIVAENLGSIPPNTAVAQVRTGASTRRFFLKSDFTSNGIIQFKWEQ